MTEKRFNDEILPLHADMFRVAAAILGNRDEAQDVVQDMMVKIWANRHKLDKVGSFKAYCYTMVRNECVRRCSGVGAMTETEEALAVQSSDNTPHDIVESRDSLRYLKQAIDEMPLVQSEVMKLSVYAGMSTSDIAAATGQSEANVRTILSRGRKKLKSLFSKI